ncbi:hypothetical protein Mapa_010267 [Marchantia paleacea]|nr:hypothetical protein Mapa_010267 [Marchantia paleacea]
MSKSTTTNSQQCTQRFFLEPASFIVSPAPSSMSAPCQYLLHGAMTSLFLFSLLGSSPHVIRSILHLRTDFLHTLLGLLHEPVAIGLLDLTLDKRIDPHLFSNSIAFCCVRCVPCVKQGDHVTSLPSQLRLIPAMNVTQHQL